MNKKFILPFLALAAIGLESASAGTSAKNPRQLGSQIHSNRAGHSDWCPLDSIQDLFAWKDGQHGKRISYCQQDSIDKDGITVISRMEILEMGTMKSSPRLIASDSVGPGLASVRFYAPGASLVDVDGDGRLEAFLPYYFAHDGADPTEIRFIARRNGKSFVIRATLPWLEIDADLYRMEIDPGLKSQSRRFQGATDSLLRDFVYKLCNGSATGATSYIPVQLGGTKVDE